MSKTLLIVIGLACVVITAAGIMWYRSASSPIIPKLKIDEYGRKILVGLKTKKWLSYKFDLKDGKSEKNLVFINFYEYDLRRNKTEHSGYKPDGSLAWRWTCKYDRNNNLIEQIEYQPDGRITYRTYAKYDQAGRMIEEGSYNESGILDPRVIYRYDINNLVEKESWGFGFSEGMAQPRHYLIKYKYNAENWLIEESWDNYFYFGIQTFKTCYKYDNAGEKIEETRYDPDGKLEYKRVCVYKNAKGSEYIVYYGDNISERSRNVYDDKGDRIEESFYDKNNVCRQSYSKKYDSAGNKILELGYTDGKPNMKWTYQHDNKNNLIEETKYQIKEADGKTEEIPIKQDIYEYEFYPTKDIK